MFSTNLEIMRKRINTKVLNKYFMIVEKVLLKYKSIQYHGENHINKKIKKELIRTGRLESREKRSNFL